MRLFACAAALCAVALAAPPPPPGTLHSVVVKGNQRYSSADILKQTGLHIGQRVTAGDLEKARQALVDLQIFQNVADRYRYSADPVNYDVTFEVTEIQQVFPFRFERLGVSESALLDFLRQNVPLYSDKIPATEAVLNRYRDAIQLFVAHTSAGTKVKATVSNEDPKQLAVVFSPNTPAPSISQVKVLGNEGVDTGTILRALNNVAVGVTATDAHLQEIQQGTLKGVYAQAGYMGVKFTSVDLTPSKIDKGVILTIHIDEGPQYKFGQIRFHGSGIDEDEVRALVKFKPGQTFNATAVDDVRIELQHRLKRRGYLDANVTDEIHPDDVARTVTVAYNVSPGAVYTFAKLEIRGLDIATQPAVEKLWGEKPGKPFNPDYPDYFLKRVEDQKIFDHLANTSSDYVADADTHNVTVRLYFHGGESQDEIAKRKKDERDKKTVDGDWSPF